MIGKPLRERNALAPLPSDKAVAILNENLTREAPALVRIRAQDARMIACLIVRADQVAVRLCRALGLRMTLGATGSVGLLGEDAARIFAQLPESKRAWLAAACGPRETKVLLVAGGIALLSIEADGGRAVVTHVE